VEEFRALRLEEIDVRYARYRLSVLEAEETMSRSLRRYGQISPVVVCLREEVPVLIDGFKRMGNWLRHHGRGDLALCDRGVLEPAFTRLVGEVHTVAELSDDFLKEIHLP
jgi:hypothetical protein